MSMSKKESNYFLAGEEPIMAEVKGFEIGFSICYDIIFHNANEICKKML